MVVVGIDIGGTEIKGALADSRGRVSAETTVATQASLGRDVILKHLFAVLDQLLAAGRGHAQVQAIGIGSAGRINVSEGKVVYATDNLPGWTGLELQKVVEQKYGLPVVVDNDVNAAVAGEAWLGAARGASSAVLLALGTGVGAGILQEGKVLRGSHWSAGELGHIILYPGGLPCNCGQRGCLEQYISGPALLRSARAGTGRAYAHGQEVFADFQQGDPAARQVVKGYAGDLAVALHNIQHFYDPELIVLGGGVAGSHEAGFKSLLQEELAVSPVPIRMAWAELGNRAGYIGAARLALESVCSFS